MRLPCPLPFFGLIYCLRFTDNIIHAFERFSDVAFTFSGNNVISRAKNFEFPNFVAVPRKKRKVIRSCGTLRNCILDVGLDFFEERIRIFGQFFFPSCGFRDIGDVFERRFRKNFKQPFLAPGETYESTTKYCFSVG